MTIRKRNDSWEYRFDVAKINGKRKQISKSGFKTKKECEKEAFKALAYYQNGGLMVNYAEISYADLLDLWFNTMKPTWKPKTADLYSNIIKNKLKVSLGQFKVKSITPLKMQEYINEVYQTHSQNYARLIRIVAGESLKYAVVPLGIISSSPCEYLRVPHSDKPSEAKVTEIEVLRQAYEEIKPPYNTALMIAFHTGLRIGEVFALNWSDIDFDNKIINVNKTLSYSAKSWRITAPKTKESVRSVPFGDQLKDILLNYRAEQLKNKVKYGKFYIKNNVIDGRIDFEHGEELDFVLTEKWGEFAKPNNMERYCRKYGFKFHSLRHLHATSLIDSGISPKIVKDRLGHSNINITLQTYTHPSDQAQREAVEVFEKNVVNLHTNSIKRK